jgi:hypothetical protein
MSGRPWTPAEIAILERDYPHTENRILAFRLKRRIGTIYQAADARGIKKTKAFLSAATSVRMKARTGAARGNIFPKGHRPWNDGVKGLHHSPATEFKKGHRPQTWVPIGNTRIYGGGGGYLQRKVADTGHMLTDWRSLHVLLWESVHGPVPKGHPVVFKDGDRNHIVIENLECISRAELARRNRIYTKYPPELARLIQLRGVLNRQINRRSP